MDAEKIGKLISKLRHEKGMTQKELADILGISPKTISKWECGSGFPDISMIKKIAEELDISVEELLDGKKLEESNKRKFNIKLFLIIGGIIAFSIGIFIVNSINVNRDNVNNDNKQCRVVRTYYIDNISRSNDENYVYFTIHEYQVEGMFTIKLSSLEAKDLVVGNSYEFIFTTSSEYVSTTTDILFDNSNVIGVEYSDKVGIDRTSMYSCD